MMAESLCVLCSTPLTHLQVDVLGVFWIALHCALLALWVVSFPCNLNGVFWVQVPKVPAQHVCTAKRPRAPWERAPNRHLAPHPLCFVADARVFLQQVICNNYLLVDVVGALKVQSETPCLEVLFAHMADYCLFLTLPLQRLLPLDICTNLLGVGAAFSLACTPSPASSLCW